MLGCAVYELCALKKPFTAESINVAKYLIFKALTTKIVNEQHAKIPP